MRFSRGVLQGAALIPTSNVQHPSDTNFKCSTSILIFRRLSSLLFDRKLFLSFHAYSPLGSPGVWVKGEVLKDPVLNEITEKLNKSTAQVCLRWGIQSAHSVLPKSVNESRIKENLSLFDWSIPPELFSKISGLHQQRLLRGDFVVHESLSPYKSVEELWDGEI